MPGGVIVPRAGASSSGQDVVGATASRGIPFKVWQPSDGTEKSNQATFIPQPSEGRSTHRKSATHGESNFGRPVASNATEKTSSVPGTDQGDAEEYGRRETIKGQQSKAPGDAPARGPSGGWIKSVRSNNANSSALLGPKSWNDEGAISRGAPPSEYDESLDSDEPSSDENDDIVLNR